MKSGTEITLCYSEDGCSAVIDSQYFQLGYFFDSDLNGYQEWTQDTLIMCDQVLAGTTPQWTRDGNTCFLEINRTATMITDGLFDGSAISISTKQFRMLVDCWRTIMETKDGKHHLFLVDLKQHPPSNRVEQASDGQA